MMLFESYSLPMLAIPVAVLMAWLVARGLMRRWAEAAREGEIKQLNAVFIDAAFIGLMVARAGHVLRWWPEYSATPWSILLVGDGGFAWWAGIPAMLIYVLWRMATLPSIRTAMGAGLVSGLLVWGGLLGVAHQLKQAVPQLPALSLQTLDAMPVVLSEYRGRPVVLNLWATWCPPCRREMPALQHAQSVFPSVDFVLVNQGESADEVSRYLASAGLSFEHALLDPHSLTMQATGARVLPSTLFFDADGRLVDSHRGELTRGRIVDLMLRRFGLTAEVR